jgi:hypothetical protein
VNPEQQQIAIAEACGLSFLYPLKRRNRSGKDDPNGVVLWYCAEAFGGSQIWEKVPNYLHSLDAMHKAEKTLPSIMEVAEYQHQLEIVTEPDRNPVWFATPVQRAEAFLKTIGKWKEKP